MAGQDKVRCSWRHFYGNTQGLIWVLDSNDRERMAEARDEFYSVINDDEMKDAVILVFANKQDLPNGIYECYLKL